MYIYTYIHMRAITKSCCDARQRVDGGGPAPQSAGGVAPPTPPTCECVCAVKREAQEELQQGREASLYDIYCICCMRYRAYLDIYIAYIVCNIVPTWKMPTSRSRSFPV